MTCLAMRSTSRGGVRSFCWEAKAKPSFDMLYFKKISKVVFSLEFLLFLPTIISPWRPQIFFEVMASTEIKYNQIIKLNYICMNILLIKIKYNKSLVATII